MTERCWNVLLWHLWITKHLGNLQTHVHTHAHTLWFLWWVFCCSSFHHLRDFWEGNSLFSCLSPQEGGLYYCSPKFWMITWDTIGWQQWTIQDEGTMDSSFFLSKVWNSMAAFITVTGISVLGPHSKGPDWWSLRLKGKKGKETDCVHMSWVPLLIRYVRCVLFIQPCESLALMILYRRS